MATAPPRLPDIKGLQENSLIEWEGCLATIVFLGGCNFRCPYCHSSPLVINPDALESIPLKYVDEMIRRNTGWLDGVVVTGGEPTLHAALPDLLTHFRRLGLRTKIYTNGTHPAMLAMLIERGIVDAVAMDVKGPLDDRYNACAGIAVDLAAIERSIELLIGSDLEYSFCTTVCPAVLSKEDVVDTAKALRGAREYILNKFSPNNCVDPALNDARPYPPDTMHALAAACEKYVQRCTIRGDYAAHE